MSNLARIPFVNLDENNSDTAPDAGDNIELEPLNPEPALGKELLEQILPLAEFIEQFGDGLLQAVQEQNPL